MRDGGTTSQGITIPPPAIPDDTLDNTMKSWCLQPHKQALVELPRWLYLHLMRFAMTDAGGTEVSISFQAREILYVPCFDSGTQLRWIPYYLAAGVMHTGPSLHAGHYHSFLTDPVGRGGPRPDSGSPMISARPVWRRPNLVLLSNNNATFAS